MIHKRILLFCCLLFILSFKVTAQQFPNDNCVSAMALPAQEEYCSLVNEFNLTGASLSDTESPFCWVNGQANRDSWFSFRAIQTGATVKVFGDINTTNADDRVFEPFVGIYEGPCSNLNEVGCGSASNNDNVVEQIITDLTLGQTYFVRVAGNINVLDRFQLCVEQFNFVPDPESDCGESVILCDKSSFQVESISGSGRERELLNADCFPIRGGEQPRDDNSAWYSWVVEQSGSLTFTITPNNISNPTEDIDFVLYRLNDGIGNCDNREVVRCMASGESQGNSDAQNLPCLGPTGLREGEIDIAAAAGCENIGDNAFLAPVNVVAGESYALLIMNFTASGQGFSIDFGGSSTFLGPVPDFEIQALEEFECDKRIIFDNLSFSDSDPIISWEWNFGLGATPTRAIGAGPHEVIYESFGEKLIALTVESEKGCTVTKILDQFIEPCCADISTLALDANANDLVCAGVPSGSIEALPSGGDPDYMFSIDNGENFQPSAFFTGLDVGVYSVIVQDIKGCADTTIMVTIEEPEELIADAGPDQILDLGLDTDLDGSFTPFNAFSQVLWSPPDSLSCVDCLDPNTDVTTTTQYILTIQNLAGCSAQDTVNIFVSANRDFYAPNILRPESELGNEFFNVFLGTSGMQVDQLRIYDRWGNLVFANQAPIQKGAEENTGWDGKFQNRLVEPGVFFWNADLRYLDDRVVTEHGTITVVR